MANSRSRCAFTLPNCSQFSKRGSVVYIPSMKGCVPDRLLAIPGVDCVSCRGALTSLKSDAEEATFVGIGTEYLATSKTSVAVLQIAFPTGNVYIIQLNGVNTLCQVIFDILTNQSITKVGVNIDSDAMRLAMQYPLLSTSTSSSGSLVAPLLSLDQVEEVSRYVSSKSSRSGAVKCSLEHLTKKYLDIEVGKDITVTISNWEAPILSIDQICYAADDALASLCVALKMITLAGSTSLVPTSPPPKEGCSRVCDTKTGNLCQVDVALGSSYHNFHMKKTTSKVPKETADVIARDEVKKAKKRATSVLDATITAHPSTTVTPQTQHIPTSPDATHHMSSICSGICKSGMPCKLAVMKGSSLCEHHTFKFAAITRTVKRSLLLRVQQTRLCVGLPKKSTETGVVEPHYQKTGTQ